VWGLGCIAHILLVGHPLVDGFGSVAAQAMGR